jgi:hypothetical protein
MSPAEEAAPSHEELAQLLSAAYARFAETMRACGFAKRAGFGRSPAVVVVDLIMLAEDTTGKGHITRDAGDVPRVTLFAPLRRSAR